MTERKIKKRFVIKVDDKVIYDRVVEGTPTRDGESWNFSLGSVAIEGDYELSIHPVEEDP